MIPVLPNGHSGGSLKPWLLIYAMEIVNCLSCAVVVRGELTIGVEAILGVLGT